MSRLDSIAKSAAGILLWIGCAAIVLMALHVTVDVVMRSFIAQGIQGTTEIVAFYYMVGAVCLPLAWIERRDEHINVEILYRALPPLGQRLLLLLGWLFSGGFFAVFTWRSWQDALNAYSTNETMMGFAQIVIWPARFILPISFVLVVIICLVQILRLFGGAAVGPQEVRAAGDDATFRA